MLFPYPGAPGENEDWMLFCPSHLRWWIAPDDKPKEREFTYLSQYHDLSLEEIEGLSLDAVVAATPEAQLLHEPTHSSKIFTLLDVDHNGQTFRTRLGLGRSILGYLFSIQTNAGCFAI